jgi:hypothetical protein
MMVSAPNQDMEGIDSDRYIMRWGPGSATSGIETGRNYHGPGIAEISE